MQREFPVSNTGLGLAFDFITQAIRDSGQDEGNAHRLSVILDELCANMIRHDETLTKDTCFSLRLGFGGTRCTMTVTDPGLPFDPLAFQHTDTPEIGGHGISLVKGLAIAVNYDRIDDRNVLTVVVDAAE